jgi:outer membrane lipoprotein-sorting protein
MLLPEFKDDFNGLTHMTEKARLEDSLIDGVDCYCIKGEWSETPTTVWIDKKTFLLRKIQWKDNSLGMTMESTTTWKPSINQAISNEVLDFNAPQEK